MEAIILKSLPHARYHFGKVAPDNNSSLSETSEWLHSDTLFSAMIVMAKEVLGDAGADALVKDFETGAVSVSSAFYLIQQGENRIFLLPKPAHLGLKVDSENFKKYKGIKLISKKLWESGLPFAEWKGQCHFIQKGQIALMKGELPDLDIAVANIIASNPAKQGESDKQKDARCRKIDQAIGKFMIFETKDYPRVRVHSQKRTESYYAVTTICIGDLEHAFYPKKKAADTVPNRLPIAIHYYFLLDFAPDYAQKDQVLALLRLLADHGIGGERAAGAGFFKGMEQIAFALTGEAGWPTCAVSLVLPTEADFPHCQYYDVLTRGGRHYASQDQRLSFVRMIKEGAYFNGPVQGSIKDITNKSPHVHLRNGRAFVLPISPIQ